MSLLQKAFKLFAIGLIMLSMGVASQAPIETISIDWSFDQQHIATTHFDNTLRIWNAMTGLTERVKVVEIPTEFSDTPSEFSDETPFITDVEWSPNGDKLAYLIVSREKSLVQIVDATNLNVLLSLDQYGALLDRIYDIDWSPDGNYIAGANLDGTGPLGDYNLYIWSSDSGEIVDDLPINGAEIRQIVWNPNVTKRQIAYQGGTTAAIWNIDLESVTQLLGHDGAINGLSWDHSGSSLLTLEGDNLRFWDPLTGSVLEATSVDKTSYFEIQWLPQRQLFLAQDSSNIVTLIQQNGVRDPEVNLNIGTAIFEVNSTGDRLVTSIDANSITIYDLNGSAIPFATLTPIPPTVAPVTTPENETSEKWRVPVN